MSSKAEIESFDTEQLCEFFAAKAQVMRQNYRECQVKPRGWKSVIRAE